MIKIVVVNKVLSLFKIIPNAILMFALFKKQLGKIQETKYKFRLLNVFARFGNSLC